MLLPGYDVCGADSLNSAITKMYNYSFGSSQGCEVVVSGKLRGQRAKAMKFVDGLMIHSGNPAEEYVDSAVRHVLLRQVRPR